MKTFKDSNNRTWQIDLNIGTVLRVKESGYNLFDPDSLVGDRTLGSIMQANQLSDWAVIWEVLWHIVEPQATGMSASDFAKAMATDRLVEAKRAFLNEWRDFFRQLQRPDHALALEKQQEYEAKMLELLQVRASQEMSSIDAKAHAIMATKLNSTFGDLQASLDAILVPSPGDSLPT